MQIIHMYLAKTEEKQLVVGKLFEPGIRQPGIRPIQANLGAVGAESGS
jgi:hypothetical protein